MSRLSALTALPALAALALATLLVTIPAGCGDVDEATLQKWSGSEAGFKKMEEYVADPANDAGLRLRALELLVEGRYARNARTLVEKAPDRDELAKSLVDRMLPKLGEGTLEDQVGIKDALLLMLVLVPDEKQTEMKKAVATWAFGGLAADATADQVREHIEARIRLGQIQDLGPYGVDGAVRMLAHGFGLERIYQFLRELKSPEVDRKILRAFEALHQTKDIEIPPHHLAKIHDLDVPEAAVYLLRLYMRDDLPRDIRGDAFGLAIRTFRKPEVKEVAAQLLPDLYKILAAGENDDRRLAAHYVLRFGGVDELAKVLASFDDDGSFHTKVYETPRFVRDICRDDVVKLRGDPVPALTKTLVEGNRVGKLLALVCLKLSQRQDVVPQLEALVADETAMGDLVGAERTLGQLAQNAVDGMKAVGELTQKRDGGKLDDASYELYRKLYEDELLLVGPDLDKAVKKQARDQQKKLKKGEELP